MGEENDRPSNIEGYRFTSIEKMIADLDAQSLELGKLIEGEQWTAATALLKKMKNIISFGHPLAPRKSEARSIVENAEALLSQSYKQKTGKDLYNV